MLRLILKLAYTAVTLIETLILIRILISVFLSNSVHTFIKWVNSVSDIFISPFEGIAPSTLVIDKIEISLTPIVALIIYAIAAFVLSELIKSFRHD